MDRALRPRPHGTNYSLTNGSLSVTDQLCTTLVRKMVSWSDRLVGLTTTQIRPIGNTIEKIDLSAESGQLRRLPL